MGKIAVLPAGVLFLLFCLNNPCTGQGSQPSSVTPCDSVGQPGDGWYSGISRGEYIYEPYWGIVSFRLEKGLFKGVSFSIRDSSLHEYFDGKYERHFAGNPEYIKQSRNDWNGVQVYPSRLESVQDTLRLDAVSGATWSYNIFRAALSDAVRKGALRNDTTAAGGR
jgi:hypothetical protein